MPQEIILYYDMYADFPSLLSLKNFLTSKFTWKWHANCHLNQHLNLNPKSTCSSSSLEYQLYVPVFFNILNSALGSWLDKERYGNIRRVYSIVKDSSVDLGVNFKIVQNRPIFVNIFAFLRENKEVSFFIFWIFKLKQP